MALKLYFAPGSCAFASLIALEEAGARYEAKPVMLAAGEQKRPEFLALSPRGQVPVMDADGKLIRENLAVLSFIANRFPDAKLLPFGDAAAIGKAYEMLSWFATNLHVAIAQIWRTERFTEDDVAKETLKAGGKRNFERTLGVFNQMSADGGAFLLGERYSVVDGLAPVAARWMKRLEIDPARYPDFNRLVANVEQRPAYARALQREASSAA
jgi:glutathione S-transferase